LSGRNSCRSDVAQLPCNQDADKDENRKSDPQRQGAGHIAGLGLAVPAIVEHEEQGRPQAGQNCEKGKNDKIFHERNYRVNAGSRFCLITAAAVLACLLTASLGFWQLNRAHSKEDLQSRLDERMRQAELDVQGLKVSDISDLQYRRVNASGQWLAERSIFLENRPMQGQVGFYVVTPLRLQDSEEVVLVLRGWVARDFQDRTRIPRLESSPGLVQVKGRLIPALPKLYELGESSAGQIRQNLDITTYSRESGLPLAPFIVQQTEELADGLLRNWPPVGTGVEKHYGYAFQWFGLCALIAILYVWFQVLRNPRRRST